MNFINNLLPQVFIHSLGWTIVHSLWQGPLIAAILGITLYFMKNSSSKSRYFVSVAFSFLLVILTVITFVDYYNSGELQNIKIYSAETYTPSNLSIDKNAAQESYFSQMVTFVKTFLIRSSQYHNYITAFWLSGAIILLINFSAGLTFQRYLRTKSFSLNSDLQNIADNTIAKLNYKGTISVAESVYAKVPMIIGFFKPIILLPAGIFAGLTYEQTELIFAHEIAHIIRKDYLVNMLLVIIDIVFFYNPAAWWISSRIKFERECSCDDIAISITNYPLTYAKALAAVLENSLGVPKYSLTLFNRKGQAMKRIERIIKHRGIQPSFKEVFFIFIVLVMSMFITITAKVNSKAASQHTLSAPDTNKVKPESSSDEYVIRKEGTGHWDGQGVSTERGTYKHVTLEWKNDIVTRLSIDGKEIDPKNFKDYPNLLSFDLHMPSFEANKDTADGEMSAGQLTIRNKIYNNVELVWKNYTPVHLSIDGKEIEKSDYDKYSDIINSYVKRK